MPRQMVNEKQAAETLGLMANFLRKFRCFEGQTGAVRESCRER